MKVELRNGLSVTYLDSVPLGGGYLKSYADLPSDRYCAMWCAQKETCMTFEHVKNTKVADDGVCLIKHT